jgi:hypothetical protein
MTSADSATSMNRKSPTKLTAIFEEPYQIMRNELSYELPLESSPFCKPSLISGIESLEFSPAKIGCAV